MFLLPLPKSSRFQTQWEACQWTNAQQDTVRRRLAPGTMEPANSLSHPSPPSILAACQPYPDYRGTLGFKGETSHTKKNCFLYFIKVTVLHTWQNSSKFSSVICIKMTLGKFQVLSSPESSNSEVTPKQLQKIPKWETSQEADLDTTLVTVSAYNNIFLLSHLENSYSSFKTLLKRGMPLLWNSLYVPWDPQYVIPSAPVPHCNGLLFYT